MATYKEVKGVTVQTRDEDPVIGGMPGGTWASSGTTNSAHYSGAGISGPAGNTSVLIAGLNASPYPAATEFWNGSSWTEVNDLNTGRYFANNMWGSYSAGAVAGGVAPSISPANTARHESWDGSSWTETTDMNNGEGGKSSSTNGPQSSAILAKNANAETWDGSSWTEVAEMNTSRTGHNGAGVSASSALIFLGAPNRDIAEEWNGSSWTEVSDLNNGREYAYGTGTTTDAMAAGGRTSPPVSLKTQTEHWNGSSWTEIADIATGRILAVGGGTSGSAMFATGQTTTNVTISEEFTIAPPTAAILTEGSIFLSGGTTLKAFGKAAGIPSATWATGGNLNTAGTAGACFGDSHSSAIYTARVPFPADSAKTESYDGTSWTEVNDLNTNRRTSLGGGSQTSGVIAGGYLPGGSPEYNNASETWDGSSWTEVAEINTGRIASGSAGLTGTAAIVISGVTSAPAATNRTANVESWDGSSWTEVGNVNTVRSQATGTGSYISALSITGYAPPSFTKTVNNESWDGTSWTEVGNVNTARGEDPGASGNSNTSALIFGGYISSGIANTEFWNGSSWTEVADLATARYASGRSRAGSSMNGIAVGGTGGTSATEEWTSDNALSTVTVS